MADMSDLLGSVNQLNRTLGAIEGHLATIAAYVGELHREKTGAKTYEVGSWVLSTTSKGDQCVYLYSTHPGLQYRVATVYVERFGELPFSPAEADRFYDGETAPSREAAGKRGYLHSCPPFTIEMLPTGGTTDKGEPVYRFSRILEVSETPPNGNGKVTKDVQWDSMPRAVDDPKVRAVLEEIKANQPADHAIMEEIRAVEREMITAGHRGPAAGESLGIYRRLMDDAGLTEEQFCYVTARIFGLPLEKATREAFRSAPKQRLFAFVKWLVVKDDEGQVIHPYDIDRARIPDLVTIMEAAYDTTEPAE